MSGATALEREADKAEPNKDWAKALFDRAKGVLEGAPTDLHNLAQVTKVNAWNQVIVASDDERTPARVGSIKRNSFTSVAALRLLHTTSGISPVQLAHSAAHPIGRLRCSLMIHERQ